MSRTRAITDSEDRQVWTIDRSTDAKTALMRGLKEYLADLRLVPADPESAPSLGRAGLAFRAVYEVDAAPPDKAVYPSAVVRAPEAGAYAEEGSLAPVVLAVPNLGQGRALVQQGELDQTLEIELWCNSPQERMVFCGLIEDAFGPTTWMSGLRLELPHYHGARAEYELKTLAYADEEEGDASRRRRALVTVRARGPVVRLVTFAATSVRLGLDVT